MNQKTLITISAAAVAMIAVVGVSTYTLAAGNGEAWGNKFSFNRQAAQETIESGDYQAWLDLEKKGRIGEMVSEENFAKFSEMHNLMKAGNTEGAEKIAEELGLPKYQRKGMQNHEEVRAAVEAGDYEAWSAITEGRKMAEYINEENFDKMVEMHNLMQEGKTDEAQAIRDELGIPGQGRGMGMGGGRMHGNCPMQK